MKRIVALITCMIMLSSISAFAAGNTRTSGLYTYEFKGNGTLRIVDFNWEASQGDIYIPSMIDGYEVDIIGERAFEVNESENIFLRNKYDDVLVTLPNTITSIEDFAFHNAPVTAINIPLKTQSIGVGALLVKPQSERININVFSGHEKYATIDGNLYNKQKRELIATADTTSAELTIPDGIRSIAAYVFENKSVILKMPETVNTIGAYAFNGAVDYYIYQRCQFSKHITALGEYAFANTDCVLQEEDLTTLFHSLSIIPSHAFYAFNPLASSITIVIPGNVLSVGDYAFSDAESSLSITIKKGVQSLGPSAFEITPGFKKSKGSHWIKITIEEGLKEIGDNCFRGQTIDNAIPIQPMSAITPNAEGITIPGSVYRIGNSAFENVKLTEAKAFTIDLKEGVAAIGDSCFSGFKNITIIIPSTVTSIGNNAFDAATVTLVVNQGSYAEAYAIENGITYKYPESAEDLSWLTDP